MGQTSEGNQSLTGKKKSKASWNSASHDVWVNLCVEEVDAGNRLVPTLIKEGGKILGVCSIKSLEIITIECN